MREIKFRGKAIATGEWYYGNLYDKDTVGRTHIGTTKKGCLNIDPETVGQFTGLKDKNGVEIYEGDVFSVNGKYPKVVKYIEDWLSFCVANIDTITTPPMSSWPDECNYQQLSPCWWKDFQNGIEVIGNIYDNPYLLKK